VAFHSNCGAIMYSFRDIRPKRRTMACSWNRGTALSSLASTLRASVKALYGEVLRYDRSRSLKVIEIGIKWKPLCDFLLVFHCNYMSIFCRFRDLTIYWWKISFFRRFTHPTLVWSPRNVSFSGNYTLWKLVSKTTLSSYIVSRKTAVWSLTMSQYTGVWQTDRQTDGRTHRLCLHVCRVLS